MIGEKLSLNQINFIIDFRLNFKNKIIGKEKKSSKLE